MARIIQAQPDQIQSQVVSQPHASGAVDPAAFGAPITKGFDTMMDAAHEMKVRIDTTTAEEALLGFEREKNDVFFNTKNGYSNTSGRNAYDAAGAANAALDKIHKKYADSLNPEARVMFDRVAQKHLLNARSRIGQHASHGLKVWEVSTINAQVENAMENAALYWNDDKAMNEQRLIGEMAIHESAKRSGISSVAVEEKVQNYRSKFAQNAIEAATVNSASDGQAQFDKMVDLLEPQDRIKVQKALKAELKSEKIQQDAQLSVLTSTNLVSQYDNRSDIIAEVNKISDPELRKKTMSQAMSQFDEKKKADSEERAQAFEDAESHVLKGGTAISYQAENPKGWEKMTAKQKKNIMDGNAAVTNWDKYSELMTMPKDQLAKVDPTEYYPDLAPEQRKALITAVKTARGTGSSSEKIDSQVGRGRVAQTTSAVNRVFGNPPRGGRNAEVAAKVDEFYNLIDSEVGYRETELKRKLSSEEYSNVLAGMTRKVVQEGIIWDTTKTIADIPSEALPELTRFLHEKKIPVTADNLIRLYEQAKK